MFLTCFLNINLAHILELPDSDVEGAEGAGPPYPGAAVHHDGRAEGVAGPGGLHGQHQLGLLLPHALQELQHAEGGLGGAVVGPGGELEVTHLEKSCE